jgi:hypothetical protein
LESAKENRSWGSEHARPSVGALTRRSGMRRRTTAAIRIGWHDCRAIASAASLNVVKPDGKDLHKLHLHLLRPGQPAVDGPLPGVRGVEHPD